METDYRTLDMLMEFLANQNGVTIDNVINRNIKNYKMVALRDLFIWIAHDYSNDLGDIADILGMKRDTAYKSKKRFLEQMKTDKKVLDNANRIKRMFKKYEKVQGILYHR